MKHTRAKIYFVIKTEEDGFDLSAFNNYLTIEPTIVELKHSRGIVPKCSSWNYSLPEIHHFDLELELKKLVSILKPHTDEFKRLREKRDVYYTIQIVLYLGEESPVLHFDEEVIGFVNAINAVIDCDVYNEK